MAFDLNYLTGQAGLERIAFLQEEARQAGLVKQARSARRRLTTLTRRVFPHKKSGQRLVLQALKRGELSVEEALHRLVDLDKLYTA